MKQEKPYRVVIVDDNRISRAFFEMIVQGDGRYQLAASFSTAGEATDYCIGHMVDLVIMDILMGTGIDGLTAAERIKRACPNTKVILATSTAETIWEDNARMIGVESFWYKEYSEESLIEVMNRTMEGKSVYPKTPVNPPIGNIRRVDLSERDLDVLREMTHGCTDEEIAARLGITVNTVRTHIKKILNRTGFKNRLSLVVNVAKLGIVVSDEQRKREEEI